MQDIMDCWYLLSEYCYECCLIYVALSPQTFLGDLGMKASILRQVSSVRLLYILLKLFKIRKHLSIVLIFLLLGWVIFCFTSLAFSHLFFFFLNCGEKYNVQFTVLAIFNHLRSMGTWTLLFSFQNSSYKTEIVHIK